MNTFQNATPDQVGLFTITDVTFRTVNKRDGTQFTIYETQTAEQLSPFTTSKKDIAESAMSLKGQQVEMHYVVKQNGNFTNYYLNAVLPAPVSPVERARQAQGAQPALLAAVGPGGVTEAPTTAPVIQQATVSEWEQQKQESIHRQTAAKVAAVLQGEEDTTLVFWSNVQLLSRYFDDGTLPTNDPVDYQGEDLPLLAMFEPIRLHFPKFRELVPPRVILPSRKKPIVPLGNTNESWIGSCPKCGRTLVSATTSNEVSPDHFECGIC